MLESLVTFPSRAASRVKEEDREGEGPSACCGRLQSGTFLCQRTWVHRLSLVAPPDGEAALLSLAHSGPST